MGVLLSRNGQTVSYEHDHFWLLVWTRQLLRSDLIFDSGTNQFLRADRFAGVEPYLPPKSLAEILEDVYLRCCRNWDRYGDRCYRCPIN